MAGTAGNTRAPNSSPVRKTTTTYLLRGLVFDADGYAMTCGVCKGKGRRYKYYVSTQAVKNNYAASPIKSVSGDVPEAAVVSQLRQPQSLSLADLMRPFPDTWESQRQHFCF